jgi:hypothetical protein
LRESERLFLVLKEAELIVNSHLERARWLCCPRCQQIGNIH